jgi:hypothetical protein
VLSLVACQHFDLWVQSNPLLETLLKSIRSEIENHSGHPLTSYRLRPGADGLRVWQSFTDSSRQTDTFFGAAGGWFRLWGSNRVFFFAHAFNPEHVKLLT